MTSVNGVSRRPAGPNYKALTWINAVSEAGVEPIAHGSSVVLTTLFMLGGARSSR